jgi:antitoxin MazE
LLTAGTRCIVFVENARAATLSFQAPASALLRRALRLMRMLIRCCNIPRKEFVMAEIVEASVQKWGNGLAIRLTQKVAKAGGVREGTPVLITARPGRLVVEAKDRPLSLQERLERFDPDRHGGEAMKLPPVGREVL